MSKDKRFQWNLPDNLAKYANAQFSLYAPEKALQESIMNKNPIPRNVHPPKIMNDLRGNYFLKKEIILKLRQIQI